MASVMASGYPIESPSPPLRPGEELSQKYRIDALIASGGMGFVFSATHLELENSVAIKVLRPELAHDPVATARFVNEARALARLKSQHAVRVLDIAPLPSGSPYVVMEYLSGSDLRTLLANGQPLPIEAAVECVLQACEAVAEAHSLGIVHRDLKPENLFLTNEPSGSALIKVLDFGISKSLKTRGMRALTHPSFALGSPHYMSPEQMHSPRDVDARSDIWSIGVVLYELLTGRCPFEDRDLGVLFAKIQNEPPLPTRVHRAEIPPELEAVVMRCLEKEQTERYQSVAELMDALRPFAAGCAVPFSLGAAQSAEPTFELVRVRSTRAGHRELSSRRVTLTRSRCARARSQDRRSTSSWSLRAPGTSPRPFQSA